MKDVKPLSKDNKINTKKNKNQTNKNKKIKKSLNVKDTIQKTILGTKTNKAKLSFSFGEINKDLKRGKINIDRRLDLHGYTLLEAYEKLKMEVKKTYNKNKRCILVITGKGVHQNKKKEETAPKLFHGKIKNSIVSWIKEEELRTYVLTYQNAGFEHGGDGAIFLYLRKKRT